MNATVDGADTSNATTSTRPDGSHAYIFVVGFFCITFLLFSLTYASYIFKRSRISPPLPTVSFDGADNHHLVSFSHGIDDHVLVRFPMFLYSEVTMPHSDTATDANAAGCSICLADYKPADVLRLLPECNHLFHVKCIDTWLKAHPTCPVCRNLPFAGVVQQELTD